MFNESPTGSARAVSVQLTPIQERPYNNLKSKNCENEDSQLDSCDQTHETLNTSKTDRHGHHHATQQRQFLAKEFKNFKPVR